MRSSGKCGRLNLFNIQLYMTNEKKKGKHGLTKLMLTDENPCPKKSLGG